MDQEVSVKQEVEHHAHLLKEAQERLLTNACAGVGVQLRNRMLFLSQ